MTPECWQQIDELLDAALARAPHERAAFLDQVCADDEALRHKVKALLTAHERAGDFLEAPALEIAAQLRAEEQVRSLLGCELGPYRILSLLGAGGMGEVYRARDARLEREVAVKVLPEHLAQNPEALLRFQREAKAVAALSHPNILAIHDVGAERGVHFAVMELLEGETLRQRLEHAALPWRKAVEIGVAVTEGLQAAHAKGIIHRDLKPENIFLTNDGQVKILDFGIARVKQMMATPAAASELTKTGAVIGTVGYMSPEQLRGQEADAPSDIFSLGCVLYEMVARRRPFVGQSAAETITAIMTEDPPALAATGKEFPLELERVIKRCLEKQASERFQSARYLGFALRAVLNDSGATASAPARLRARLRPAIWIGVAMAVLLFGIAVWSYLRGAGKQAVDSLVVLPLANGSSDPNLEYLSDGITEGIINSVSQLPGLKVVARTTAFRYKGREVDPQAIGRELKVRAVFIGKVTQRGETLSVQADLLDAADGSQLWGEHYHRRVADLIPLQEEIALQIAEKLRLKLTRAEQERLKKHYPENAEAYLLYLKGDFYYSKLTPDGARTSIAYFNQALAKDPEYALAYSGLSLAQGLLPETDLPGRERCLKAKFYAEKALLLNDELAEAHVALGTFNFFCKWDWPASERELQRALVLNPNLVRPRNSYAMLLQMMGRDDEASAQLKRALELDPLSILAKIDVGWGHYYARRYEPAIAECQEVLNLDPNFFFASLLSGMAYGQQGKYQEAIAELRKTQTLPGGLVYASGELGYLYGLSGQRSAAQRMLRELQARAEREHVDPYSIAIIHLGLGDIDQMFAWLDKAYEARSWWMIFLKVEPRFDRLRADPRFTALLQRLALAP